MPKGVYSLEKRRGLFKKDHPQHDGSEKGWFKKGQKAPWTTKRNKENYGEKSPSWKGEQAGYDAKHSRIKRLWNKTGKCEKCNQEKYTEWSNNSGKFLRNRSDWEELCIRCHRIKDDWINKVARKNRRQPLVITT